MKSFFITSFLTLLSFLALAHKDPAEFGQVRKADLTMKSYAHDTAAAAVILFDKGSTVLTSLQSGHLTYKRHVRIKIFRKEAFEDWVNVTLFAERGTFSKLKGTTYNLEEDSVIKSEIDDKAIFKTRFNKYIDQIRFTLPNVKEGSVIEYNYIIKGEIGVAPWQFQYSIPVVFSEYTVEVPGFFNMNYTIKGLISPAYEVKN